MDVEEEEEEEEEEEVVVVVVVAQNESLQESFVCLVTRHASKTRRRCAMQHQQALLEDHIISRHSLLSVSQSPPILQRHKHHFLLVLHPLLQTSITKTSTYLLHMNEEAS